MENSLPLTHRQEKKKKRGGGGVGSERKCVMPFEEGKVP